MENQQENQSVQKKLKLKKCISICLSGGDIPEGKHMTLSFKPKGEARKEWIANLPEIFKNLGKEISYEEVCILQDENVITVVCQMDDSIEQQYYKGSSLPHVTMETFDDAEPVLSNDLIQQEMHSNAFLLRNEDATFPRKAFLSAMFYSKDGKSYSTSVEDWEV